MSTIIKNPIIWSDVPDVEVLRVEDTFYMVSTTMHVLPGCPIMKSKNLKDWEIVSYVFDEIEDNDMYRLENKAANGAYGRGQWATSLRYNNGIFYICFVCNEMKKTYIYTSCDLENGEWERHTLEGIFHDPSLLFDDGRLFIIYSGGDIRITELNLDGSGVKEGGVDQLLFSTPAENIMLRCEGCHAYKIGGYYYIIFIEWPTDGHERRRQICYRSKELLGTYERRIILDDDMGYHNRGIAQGAIFDDQFGNWYAMLFQDHDAVGRIPYLMPMRWEDDWPVLGDNGVVPEEFEVAFDESELDNEVAELHNGVAKSGGSLIMSDSFSHKENVLAKCWQWNHAPDNSLWSFTERPGYLRLKTGSIRDDVLFARNTLTQRTVGPKCQCTVKVDLAGIKDGDFCGLIALQSNYGTVGAKAEAGKKYIVMTTKDGEQFRKELSGSECYLRIYFDFEDSRDIADFYYSEDGSDFEQVGVELKMLYTLDHFMGYRVGIFNFATKEIGGYADFCDFVYEVNE